MKRIRIGRTELESSQIVHGCMRIRGDNSAADREKGKAAVCGVVRLYGLGRVDIAKFSMPSSRSTSSTSTV